MAVASTDDVLWARRGSRRTWFLRLVNGNIHRAAGRGIHTECDAAKALRALFIALYSPDLAGGAPGPDLLVASPCPLSAFLLRTFHGECRFLLLHHRLKYILSPRGRDDQEQIARYVRFKRRFECQILVRHQCQPLHASTCSKRTRQACYW